MKKIKIIIVFTISVLLTSCATKQGVRTKAIHSIKEPKTLNEVQQYAVGEWKSISMELRPTEDRTGSGKINPTYVKRNFVFNSDKTFKGVITMYGDNYGKLPLFEFEFKGHTVWGEAHPIADGAWKVDYVLDKDFGVTPINPQATQMLNAALPVGMSSFRTNEKKDILKKAFPMFNIKAGEIVSDYDLIYFKNGMLFMGAKHVDGTPFDKPENRPHQLQVPLEKVFK